MALAMAAGAANARAPMPHVRLTLGYQEDSVNRANSLQQVAHFGRLHEWRHAGQEHHPPNGRLGGVARGDAGVHGWLRFRRGGRSARAVGHCWVCGLRMPRHRCLRRPPADGGT